MTKLAPPPRDPSAEARLPADVRAALDEYVALERRVRPLASGAFAHVCAACRSPCCRAVYCAEAWESPWLRAVTSRRGAVRAVAPEDAIEGHLARDGCRLRFGRPPVCYEFACWDILGRIATDEEKYLFRVISHVMTFAGEGALPRTHLVEVRDLARLAGRPAARLRERIALAGRIFDAAARLFAEARARPGAARPGSAADWALVTRWFPPDGYRLAAAKGPRVQDDEEGRRKTPRMRSLPIVRAVAFVALAAFGVAGASGCGAPPRKLSLSSPAPVAPDVFRNDDVQFRFSGTAEALEVEVLNRSGERLAIPWWKARFLGPDGAEREVVAFEGEAPAREALSAAGHAVTVLPPGASWRGRVHPLDRLRRGGGARVAVLSLLAAEEAEPERTVGLDVEIEVGRRPERLEFRFTIKSAEDVAS